MTSIIEHYQQEFNAKQHAFSGAALSWLNQHRQQALTRLVKQGFPTTRDERWKYTTLNNILQTPFALSTHSPTVISPQKIKSYFVSDHVLVFVNGIYVEALSCTEKLPKTIVATSLANKLIENPEQIKQHLGSCINQTAAFENLNTALYQDGCFIEIPDNASIDEPIQLLFISSGLTTPTTTQLRNLVILGKNARASVIEHYLGLDNISYLTNTVTEIIIGENAELSHYKVNEEHPHAFHIGSVYALQERDSLLNAYAYSQGGRLVRSDTHAALAGENAQCRLLGLYLAKDRQHIDHHTVVEHRVPHCQSQENYKGLIDDHARAVFNGKIFVACGAIKSNANLINKNLLLSANAEIDTKPELEIYNDDVKCTHGATVGQLDSDALFYLRSRGMALDEAKSLLTFGFAEEIVREVKWDKLRDYLLQSIKTYLPNGKFI